MSSYGILLKDGNTEIYDVGKIETYLLRRNKPSTRNADLHPLLTSFGMARRIDDLFYSFHLYEEIPERLYNANLADRDSYRTYRKEIRYGKTPKNYKTIQYDVHEFTKTDNEKNMKYTYSFEPSAPRILGGTVNKEGVIIGGTSHTIPDYEYRSYPGNSSILIVFSPPVHIRENQVIPYPPGYTQFLVYSLFRAIVDPTNLVELANPSNWEKMIQLRQLQRLHTNLFPKPNQNRRNRNRNRTNRNVNRNRRNTQRIRNGRKNIAQRLFGNPQTLSEIAGQFTTIDPANIARLPGAGNARFPETSEILYRRILDPFLNP
jgi:hypothetical protein